MQPLRRALYLGRKWKAEKAQRRRKSGIGREGISPPPLPQAVAQATLIVTILSLQFLSLCPPPPPASMMFQCPHPPLPWALAQGVARSPSLSCVFRGCDRGGEVPGLARLHCGRKSSHNDISRPFVFLRFGTIFAQFCRTCSQKLSDVVAYKMTIISGRKANAPLRFLLLSNSKKYGSILKVYSYIFLSYSNITLILEKLLSKFSVL